MTAPDRTEIAIIGGGLTGQMMAHTLAHTGYDITLIDRAAVSTKSATDFRTTTIHAAGSRMLSALGIWEHISPAPEPIAAIKVGAETKIQDWDLTFSSDSGVMAYTVSNQALSDALATQPLASPLKEIEAEIASIDFAAETPLIYLANGQNLSADLIIGCDGAGSFTRQEAGLTVWPRTTNQKAIVARVTSELHHNQTAYQRFLANGPLAFMPLQDNELSLVWSLTETQADILFHADRAEFEQALNAALGDDLGQLALNDTDSGVRQIWPLRPTVVPQLTAKGLVLAGDAAHALHPLAGMGFNLALSDMAVLADILASSYGRGLSAGHAANLSQYAHRRRAEILALSAVTEGLNKLFSHKSHAQKHIGAATVAKLAGLGMRVIGKSRLDTYLSKLAMGGILSPAALLDGHLPK